VGVLLLAWESDGERVEFFEMAENQGEIFKMLRSAKEDRIKA